MRFCSTLTGRVAKAVGGPVHSRTSVVDTFKGWRVTPQVRVRGEECGMGKGVSLLTSTDGVGTGNENIRNMIDDII